MGFLKRALPYMLACSIFLSSGSARSGEERFFRIADSSDKIQARAETYEDSESLESRIRDSVLRKDISRIPRDVPILMLHEIGESDEYGKRYCVTPEMFRRQLSILYNNGYVLFSLSEYVNGDYKLLPSDKKPVVLTFDDATEGQFRYLEDEKGRPHVDPDCGFGILQEFYKMHPDFRMKATFFIDFVDKKGDFQVPFGQEGYEISKIDDIIDSGMEIGNHSLEHINMKKSSVKDINNNIRYLDYILNLIKHDHNIEFLAFPYGAIPSNKVLGPNKKNYDYAFMAWGGVAPDIDSKRFNRYRIPRIEINNDMKNLCRYVLNKQKT